MDMRPQIGIGEKMRKYVAVCIASLSTAAFVAMTEDAVTTPTEAKQRARVVASSFGQNVTAIPSTVRETTNVGGARQWEVTYRKGYGIIITLDAAQGFTTLYHDNDSEERRRLAGPKHSFLLRSKEAAGKYVDTLAKRHGLQTGWKRVYLDFYLDNTPGRGDSNRCGAISATYQPTEKGYPYFNYPPRLWIHADPFDGKLIEYYYSNYTLAGPVDIRVTAEIARKTAESIHAKERIVRRISHKAIGAPKLGWAVPNGFFGGKVPADDTAPFQARLAYKVDFDRSWIYIDAKTGECLGGDATKNLMPPPPKRKGKT